VRDRRGISLNGAEFRRDIGGVSQLMETQLANIYICVINKICYEYQKNKDSSNVLSIAENATKQKNATNFNCSVILNQSKLHHRGCMRHPQCAATFHSKMQGNT